MKGVQLFGLFFTLIGSANAAFTVDASHSKTKDVTIKGFTKQGKPDEMKFKAGETILVKGIGLGLSHTVLLDVIKIDAINKKMRWWSSPSVTSGKTSGTITGKDSLADHLNALKQGWQKRKDKAPKKVDGNWAWVEKLGQSSKALYKENDTPSYADGSKPGAGSAGSIDPALKSKFPIPETKSAHQGFNYMMNEFNNDYDRRQDFGDEDERQDSQSLGPYYSNFDTNVFVYGLTIIVLLLIVIGCIGCLLTGIAGGAFGYQMARKANIQDSIQLNKEYQRIDA